MKIKVYGCRGSIPFFSRNALTYGGNTACVRVDALGHIMILDGGTGVVQFSYDMRAAGVRPLKCDLLLSHLHLDHISGLHGFVQLFEGGNDIRIFTQSRGDRPLAEQVFGIFRPPYFPIDLTRACKAELNEITCGEPFSPSEGITVTPFKAEHPNTTASFRIDADRSLVYLLDYEVAANLGRYDELVGFCKDADVVIFDSSYNDEDYPPRRGWGHSTFDMGVRLAEDCGCGKMIFSHFAQEYDDLTLHMIAAGMRTGKHILAYDGMELEL